MSTNATAPQLKAARTLLGISQKQIADLLHISVDSVWRCERGIGSQRTANQIRGLLQRNGAVFSPNGAVRYSPEASAEYRAWLQRWR
jgi:transcriptional regulator with XRE-family HTH domain